MPATLFILGGEGVQLARSRCSILRGIFNIKVDITAKYEKSTFIYTITLSKDLDLAELGFYSKPND